MSKPINTTAGDSTFRYTNETFSGCDMTATITTNTNTINNETGKIEFRPYTKVVGELTTLSYSIHMEKKPIRSIGNVNAKDYVMGPRTIAGSLVFSVFNKHFAEDLIANVNANYKSGTAFLVDELPPFDLTISAANEYGYRSRLAIYGIRLLNEGQVMSINDVYTENTYQFFATDLEYLNDEMFFTRDESSKMYKLKDSFIKTFPKDSSQFQFSADYWSKEQEDNYINLMDRPIKLLETVKQPTRENTPGIVTFIIDPPQDQGIVIIKNSKEEITNATISEVEDNKARKISIALQDDTYFAHFENTKNKKVSNKVKFTINAFYNKDKLSKYAPIIERVTDSTINIYTNEPSHNKLKISWIGSAEGASNIYDIVARRCILTELQPNTEYTIYSFNETDKLPSRQVKVRTLTSKDDLFNQLTLFCYANSRELIFSDMIIYNDLLEEAKLIAINLNKDTTDSILIVKKKYQDLILELGTSLEDLEIKDKYDLKIKACNELIEFSSKLFNDYINAINIISPVAIPTMTLNNRYENVFKFNLENTTAEFYKSNNKSAQFHYEVQSYNFKNIDGVENSFRYIGKPGYMHYVEALTNRVRSPKLEFYVMTQIEKEEFIEKDNQRDKITDKDKDEINSQINKDEILVLETNEYKRAFMINAKRISNPLLLPPEIETINENVLVRTSINSLIDFNYNNNYYIALATYEELLCGSPMYKVKFTNKEDVIAITRLLNGLKEDNVYALWIENEEGIQLSNASTFVYSEDFSLEDDDMKEYELKDTIDKIKTLAINTLPKDIYDDILTVIENNRSITNYNFINEVLAVLMNTVISKSILVAFLKEFKYFLGIMGPSESIMFNNINYKNELLEFNSLYTGSLIIYNVYPGDSNNSVSILEDINKINTTIYQDLILVIAIDEKLNKKSNLILINKKEKYMEVL